MIKPTDVILFQGDSITDTGRQRDNNAPNVTQALGSGYALFAGASILTSNPGVKVYNRGVSGDRVTYMAKRWQTDAIDLKPTIISILIGVNDTWHGAAKDTPQNGVDLPTYDKVFRKLLDDTKAALPGVTLVICDPFALRCGAVNELNFFPDIFDEAIKRAQPAFWAADGVHPSAAGHMLMAQKWVEAVSKA